MSVKVLQRSKGRSTVAAAAYRAATVLTDSRTGREFDFRRKKHVIDSFILAPEGAPSWALDRAQLWNHVEAAERRKDAVCAREVEISIPRDLPRDRWREFVESVMKKYITAGAVCDVAIHAPKAADGQEQPHAHILMTPRRLDPSTESGFASVRNATLAAMFESGGRQGGERGSALKAERARVSDLINSLLREVDSGRRVDSRSYAARGLDREPEPQMGEQRMASVRRRRLHDRRTAVVSAFREHRKALNELQKVEEEMSQNRKGFPRLPTEEARTDYKSGLLRQRFPDFDPSPFASDINLVDVRRRDRIRIQCNDGGWVEVKGRRISTWGPDGQAAPLAAALAEDIGIDKGGFQHLKKSAAVRRNPSSRPVPLTEYAITSIADSWRERGYEDVTESHDGAWVSVAESRLHDTGDYVTVHGSLSDESIRALVEKAHDEWGAQLESHGPEEFRERLWLEAQRQDVAVIGYDASDALKQRWAAEVAQKAADEQILAGVRRVASEADLLIAAARGDLESVEKLDPDLKKFVSSYLDDNQRAELARQRPLDIVAELENWRAKGRAEAEHDPDALGSIARPAVEAAPTDEQRPT
ncbi:MobA/MobL family protein [Pleomorphomonas oryzae]|uniref:MobA/MobL family protein n=1 Tax=Pleomorphomonas oryzae TaxID=261934 RepID=UPI0004188C2C|nr:MobA/MobL family protein [Pleomorphomonas oryzae]